MEVKYMWGQEFRISTLLYILCRYALVGNVIYLVGVLENRVLIHLWVPTYPIANALPVCYEVAFVTVTKP